VTSFLHGTAEWLCDSDASRHVTATPLGIDISAGC
jgi:hypothetical protein